MFNEICIYEAKLTKLDEIEELMREVAEFYLKQDGVIDVHYIKRTHRQKMCIRDSCISVASLHSASAHPL